MVEHILGKDEVTSSILVVGSISVKAGRPIHEKHHHAGLYGMQTAELHDDEKQEDDAGSP